jgi:hypothetical protein
MIRRRPKSPEEEYMKEVHDEEMKGEHKDWRKGERIEEEEERKEFKDYGKKRIKKDYLIKKHRKEKFLGGVRGKPTRGARGGHK